jgi:hypothetical protein
LKIDSGKNMNLRKFTAESGNIVQAKNKLLNVGFSVSNLRSWTEKLTELDR